MEESKKDAQIAYSIQIENLIRSAVSKLSAPSKKVLYSSLISIFSKVFLPDMSNSKSTKIIVQVLINVQVGFFHQNK